MSELAETRSSLYCQYALIAGQHLLTLITRIALPYFVAFISVEAGLTDSQRSTLLSSFTAGCALHTHSACSALFSVSPAHAER